VYQGDVLQGVVKPLNTTLFSGQKWVFQQDSAPAHKAKMTQEWLWRHVPTFISAEDWPSGSPDLNPLDYKQWAVFEDMACQKRHDLDSLKRFLVKAAAEIPLKTVCAMIAE
jgi:inhibitor of nuclear factor kappa-B kinase subunit alpha